MIRITQKEWDTFTRHKDAEILNENTVNAWVMAHQETILKADSGELNDIEKAEIDVFNKEFTSFMRVEVVGVNDDLLNKGLKYETFYVREKQIEFEKAEGDEIQKSRHGRYLDTPLNRKMGRVGAEFGEIQKSEEEKLEKGDGVYKDTPENEKLGRVGQKYTLYRKGGSTGEDSGNKTNFHPVHGRVSEHSENKEELDAKAKRMNSSLSEGEKKYYGIKYHVKPYQKYHD